MSAPSLSSATRDAFYKLLQRVELTDRDRALFNAHMQSARTALVTHVGAERVDLIGSAARGSAIHGSSDADLLAILPDGITIWGGRFKSSTTILSQVRGVLEYRFHATEVGRDGQAIVVSFGDGTHPMDVVPAVWLKSGGPYDDSIYLIPDGEGGWMETAPTTHNRFIAEADRKAGGKLKYTARLFKHWRDTRATRVPINGFHVEMLLASSCLCSGAQSYAEIVRDLLVLLASRDCAALQDPCDVSGYIAAAGTRAKREQATRTVYAAAEHAVAAVEAERRGNDREAARQWDIVFNGTFPR